MAFKKGQSGNPGGKKKGTLSVKAVLEKKLMEAAGSGKTRLEAFVDTMLEQATTGNHHWGAMLLDRFEGRVVEKVEMDVNLPTSYAGVVKNLKAKRNG